MSHILFEKDLWFERFSQIGLIDARMSHSTVALNGKLYSMGGFNVVALSSVEEYAPEDQQISVTSQGKLSTTWGQQKSKE